MSTPEFRPPHKERRKPKQVVDELIFRSYCHHRMMFPEIQPERWALIFSNVACDGRTILADLHPQVDRSGERGGSTQLSDKIVITKESMPSMVSISSSGCWLWNGQITSRGYARCGTKTYVHRVVYETWKGAIPDGFQIDHICRNTKCVNPDHLEAVSPRENNLRGYGTAAINARREKCRHGHNFDFSNTYIRPNGNRGCKACRAVAMQRFLNSARSSTPADSKVSDVADVSPDTASAGGEVRPPVLSSPLQFLARVDSVSSEDKDAVGEVSLRAEKPCPLELRQDALAIHSRFPADDRFADNIYRALDACDLAERDRLEDIEAEREGLMTEMSGYPQPGRFA